MKDQNKQPISGYVVNVSVLKISKIKRIYFGSSISLTRATRVKRARHEYDTKLSTTLEMPRSHAKIRLKSAPQKLNFEMAKAILKSSNRALQVTSI